MTSRFRTSLRLLLLTGTLISLFYIPWKILWAWGLPLPDTVEQQVAQALEHGFDGVIVYIQQSNEPAQFHAAGWHDRDNKIAADPKALFKIASIGKLYDAASITRLVYDDRLSLNKTVADYFPELVGRLEYADRITLRMLVNHRSGIANFTDLPNYWNDPPESREKTLEQVLELPANFEPGEGYAYSNTNYLLITELIEKVSGKTKFEFIKEEILAPLGLNNTFGSLSEVNSDDLMSGYYVGIEADLKAEYDSMIATAEDVGIFLRALNDGSLFEPEEQGIYSSIYVYEHTGLIPGYQSIARYYENMDTVVVQFTNTTDFQGYNWSLSEIVYKRLVKILRQSKLQP